MSWIYTLDFFVSLFLAVILFVIYWSHFRDHSPRHVWTYIRYQGGGQLRSPGPITESQAVQWITKNNSEVTFIDREHWFIFYRPRGG